MRLNVRVVVTGNSAVACAIALGHLTGELISPSLVLSPAFDKASEEQPS